MGKTKRFRVSPRDNASKGHVKFGEALKRIFPLGKIYQEYPYDKIIRRGYSVFDVPEEAWNTAMLSQASRLHADWVVLDRMIILEYNGQHHYEEIHYSSDPDQGRAAFIRRQSLDKKKRQMANEAQFLMIEIPYFEDKISDEELIEMIKGVMENQKAKEERVQNDRRSK